MEQWSVCLPEHHPGYVSWPEYLQTRERLRANVRPRGEGGGVAREGAALLQGLLRCGRCGRRMQVAYSGTAAGVSPLCVHPRSRDLHATGQSCQTLGGVRLDRAVAAAFLEAVTPAGVAAIGGGDRRAGGPASRHGSPASAWPRASRVRGRARAAPVRRLRARASARRADPRTRARGRARRRRARTRQAGRARTRPAGAADRQPNAKRSRASRATCRGCGRPRQRPTATARNCCAR